MVLDDRRRWDVEARIGVRDRVLVEGVAAAEAQAVVDLVLGAEGHDQDAVPAEAVDRAVGVEACLTEAVGVLVVDVAQVEREQPLVQAGVGGAQGQDGREVHVQRQLPVVADLVGGVELEVTEVLLALVGGAEVPARLALVEDADLAAVTPGGGAVEAVGVGREAVAVGVVGRGEAARVDPQGGPVERRREAHRPVLVHLVGQTRGDLHELEFAADRTEAVGRRQQDRVLVAGLVLDAEAAQAEGAEAEGPVAVGDLVGEAEARNRRGAEVALRTAGHGHRSRDLGLQGDVRGQQLHAELDLGPLQAGQGRGVPLERARCVERRRRAGPRHRLVHWADTVEHVAGLSGSRRGQGRGHETQEKELQESVGSCHDPVEIGTRIGPARRAITPSIPVASC